MSRKPTANEIRLALARFAGLPPDDVDGYAIVLARAGDAPDVIGVLTNASDEAGLVTVLARAIEQRAAALRDPA